MPRNIEVMPSNKVTHLFLSLLMLCFIGVQPVVAQQAPLPQDAQYEEWMTYYYVHKDTAKVNDFLQWLQNSKTLEKNKGAIPPVAVFLSIVFAGNPQQVQGWVKTGEFTGKTKAAVEFALWHSGNRGLIAEIFKDTSGYVKSNPLPFTNLALKNANDIDVMWHAFFASGDIVYVKKIIDILDNSAPLTTEFVLDVVTRVTAESSLGRNMVRHGLVDHIIRKEINERTGVAKEKLEEIVAHKDQYSNAERGSVGERMIPPPKEEEPTGQENAKSFPQEGDLVAQELSIAQRLSSDPTIDLSIITAKGFVTFTVGSAWPINAIQTKMPIAVAGFQIPNAADEGTSDSTNLAVSLYQPASEKAQSAMKLIGKKYGPSKVAISKKQDWTIYSQTAKQGNTPYTIIDAKKQIADVIVGVRLAWPHLKNNPADYDEQMKKTFDSVLRSVHGDIGPRPKRDGEILRRPTL